MSKPVYMRILSSICLLCFLVSCSESKISELDVLIGTWKIQGKNQFEVWEKNNNNELSGYSFKLDSIQKTITETLSIKETGNQIIYEATVPDQNEGETVQFVMNTEISSCFSFENDMHDFPKKIQYRIIAHDEIEISVLGEEGNSFSYTQLKQKKRRDKK